MKRTAHWRAGCRKQMVDSAPHGLLSAGIGARAQRFVEIAWLAPQDKSHYHSVPLRCPPPALTAKSIPTAATPCRTWSLMLDVQGVFLAAPRRRRPNPPITPISDHLAMAPLLRASDSHRLCPQ